MTGFVRKIISRQAGNLYLVTGLGNKKPAWYFILVDKFKLPLFKREVQSPHIDLARYGKVIHSGWGEHPPQEIIDSLKAEYGSH